MKMDHYDCDYGMRKYWSDRPEKLRRYPRQSLDPSWYTDNIYSNQSIDLDEDFNALNGNELYQRHSNHNRRPIRDFNGNKNDDIFIFHSKSKTVNITETETSKYKYPKSTSCCFGIGSSFDQSTSNKPKPNTLPKSHSFSTSRVSSNFAKIREIKNNYDAAHPMMSIGAISKPSTAKQNASSAYHHHSIDFDRNRLKENRLRMRHRNYSDDDKNEYLLTRVCDREGCVNETCFTKDPVIQSKPSKLLIVNDLVDDDDDDNWNVDDIDLVNDDNLNLLYDNNGNQSEYFTADEDSYEDGARSNYSDDYYNLKHYDDNSSSTLDDHMHYNSSRNIHYNHHSLFDENLDQLIKNERTKLLMQNKMNKYRDDFNDDFNYISPPSPPIPPSTTTAGIIGLTKKNKMIKNKSLLEVKPPNKYDDSSADSTDLELDDFNFDFVKYWEELDKPTMSSNNNSVNINNNLSKIKNVNILRRYNRNNHHHHHHLQHHNDDDEDDDDDDDIVIGIDHEDDARRSDDDDDDSYMYERKIPNSEYNDDKRTISKFIIRNNPTSFIGSPFRKFTSRKVHPIKSMAPPLSHLASSSQHPHHSIKHQTINSPYYTNFNNYRQSSTGTTTTSTSAPMTGPTSGSSNRSNAFNSTNSNAISLINNIFSIYKPNKYSPLNCHTQQIGLNKPQPCKKMNVSSTIRPLGGGGVGSSSHHHPHHQHHKNDFMTSLKRPLLVSPQFNQEQARFKIIPDKTGLKISPLYRFEFGGKNQYKLKSTARPLLFRH